MTINETLPVEIITSILEPIIPVAALQCIHTCKYWRDIVYAQCRRCQMSHHRLRVQVCMAAADDMSMLKWLHTRGYLDRDEDITDAIVATGDINKLVWLHSVKCMSKRGAYEGAAKYGRLQVLEWMDSMGKRTGGSCSAQLAAMGGHLKTFKWLHEHGEDLDSMVVSEAARNGQLNILKYLHKKRCIVRASREPVPYWWRRNGDFDEVARDAISGGHMHIVEWLISIGELDTDAAYESAAFNDNADLICMLVEMDVLIGAGACAEAICGGNMEILEQLHAFGAPLDSACEAAASCGRKDLLIWARERGAPWCSRTCSAAAAGGHLDVLSYAHDRGCPWNEWTCSRAAEYGHTHVLQYAHERGCPWNEWTCARAAQNEHAGALRYALEHGCPCGDDDWMFERYYRESNVYKRVRKSIKYADSSSHAKNESRWNL